MNCADNMRICLAPRSLLVRVALTLVVTVFAAPGAAWAADKGAADKAASEKAAIELAAQAKSAFVAGAFARAAGLYMDAYGQYHEPTLVFNAGRAYQQAGQPREALPLFQLYLSVTSDKHPGEIEGRRDARDHIAQVQALIDKEDAAPQQVVVKPVQPQPVDPKPIEPNHFEPAPNQNPTIAVKPEDHVHNPALFERVQSRHPRPSGPSHTGSFVAGGAGIALIVGGLVLGGMASSDVKDLQARLQADRQVVGGTVLHTSVRQAEVNSAYVSHNNKQIAGSALLAVGSAAVVTAVVLWLLPTDQQSTDHVQLLPGVAADGVHVALLGRF